MTGKIGAHLWKHVSAQPIGKKHLIDLPYFYHHNRATLKSLTSIVHTQRKIQLVPKGFFSFFRICFVCLFVCLFLSELQLLQLYRKSLRHCELSVSMVLASSKTVNLLWSLQNLRPCKAQNSPKQEAVDLSLLKQQEYLFPVMTLQYAHLCFSVKKIRD